MMVLCNATVILEYGAKIKAYELCNSSIEY